MKMAIRSFLYVLLGQCALLNCDPTLEDENKIPGNIFLQDDIHRHLRQGQFGEKVRKRVFEYEYEDPCTPITNPCKPKTTGKMFGCPREILCDPRYIYRTNDGTCNNLNNPLWGSSESPFNRFLPSVYEDGISLPRGHRRNPPLPSPRRVSVSLNQAQVPKSNKRVSLMVMQFGQYTDHDITFTPDSLDAGDRCCQDFKTLNTSNFCYQLDLLGDSFYYQHNVKCMPFIKSLTADEFCRCGEPREQINALSSYIDGTEIYGSNSAEEKSLRSFIDGKLKIGPGDEGGYCPAVCPLTFLPERKNAFGQPEFFGGDSRVEEQPGLTSIHTLFVRFHNSLAERLKAKYSFYDDEKIYQEIRRIVIAVLQQITYGEFLPIILGTKSMIANNLYPINESVNAYETRYLRTIDATIANVIASAAFRFGHTLVSDVFRLNGTDVILAESFNSHTRTLGKGTLPSDFLKGIAAQDSEPLDSFVIDTLTNKLLAVSPFKFGRDLVTLNIMRARSHGIPPYNVWRKFCGLSTMRNFSDLSNVMPEPAATALMVYGNVDDIDLFPAAISETSLTDGLLPPTLTCLIEKQFFNLKFGDRFWFESLYQPKVFTFDQLRSIHQTRLSTVICKCTDATKIQLNVLKPVDQSNPLIACSDILKSGVSQDINDFW